ncbi:MAG: DUF368 domain-containing protein [Pirellulaceae bacterium]
MPENTIDHSPRKGEQPKLEPGAWIRGVGMGAADVVPGFSGGTVALFTGIYERLVGAISQFDRQAFQHFRKREWSKFAEHVDLFFLCWLVLGIACGFVASTLTVKSLLDAPATRPYVLAAFVGMVLGASVFVFRSLQQIAPIGVKQVLVIVAGAAIAAALSLMPANLRESPPYWFIFVSGAIGICAMILPGISGALMLMILGIYEYLMGIARSLIHLDDLFHCLNGLRGVWAGMFDRTVIVFKTFAVDVCELPVNNAFHDVGINAGRDCKALAVCGP